MPTPSPALASLLAMASRVSRGPATRPLEVAVVESLRNELNRYATPVDTADGASAWKLYGLPVVVDDRIPPALGGWTIREPGHYDYEHLRLPRTREIPAPRPLTVRDDRGHRADVGHGEGAVALVVAAGAGRVGSMTLTPEQARSLGVLLIEQAGHAAAAAAAAARGERPE